MPGMSAMTPGHGNRPAARQIAHTPRWPRLPPLRCELISFIPQVLLLSAQLIDWRGGERDLKLPQNLLFFVGKGSGFGLNENSE